MFNSYCYGENSSPFWKLRRKVAKCRATTLRGYTDLSGSGLPIGRGVRALTVRLLTTAVIGFREEGRDRKQTRLVKWGMAQATSPFSFSVIWVILPSHKNAGSSKSKRKARARFHQQSHSEEDQRHTAYGHHRHCSSQADLSGFTSWENQFVTLPRTFLTKTQERSPKVT